MLSFLNWITGGYVEPTKQKTPPDIRKFAAEFVRGHMSTLRGGPMHIAHADIAWMPETKQAEREAILAYLRTLGFKGIPYEFEGVEKHHVVIEDIYARNPLMAEVRAAYNALYSDLRDLVVEYLIDNRRQFYYHNRIALPTSLGEYNLRYVDNAGLIVYAMANGMFQDMGLLIQEGFLYEPSQILTTEPTLTLDTILSRARLLKLLPVEGDE